MAEVVNTANETFDTTEDESSQNPNAISQWACEVISFSSQYNDVSIQFILLRGFNSNCVLLDVKFVIRLRKYG